MNSNNDKKKIRTPSDILKDMEDLKNSMAGETSETGHIMADDLLVELVRLLGFNDIANSYDKIGKWYA